MRQQRNAETESDARDQGGLRALQAMDRPHAARHDEQANGDQHRQETDQLARGLGHIERGRARAAGNGGERGHRQNSDQVPGDQNTHHHTADHHPATGAACVYLYVADAAALADAWRTTGSGRTSLTQHPRA